MKRCPNCGFMNFDISVICGRCEFDLGSVEPPMQMQSEPLSEPQPEAQPEPQQPQPQPQPIVNPAQSMEEALSSTQTVTSPPIQQANIHEQKPIEPQLPKELQNAVEQAKAWDAQQRVQQIEPVDTSHVPVNATAEVFETDSSDPHREEPPPLPAITNVHLGSWKRRALSWLIDNGLVLAISLSIGYWHYNMNTSGISNDASPYWGVDWIVDLYWSQTPSVILTISCFAFFTLVYQLFAIGYFGQTLGHAITKLKVISISDGRVPSAWRSALRALIAFLGFLFAGIGHFWRIIDPFQRGIHDITTRTIVISTKEEARDLQ